MLRYVRNILIIISCFFSPAFSIAQAPSISLLSNDPLLIRFPYVAAGQTSSPISVRFRASNMTSPLAVIAPSGFELSKNNIIYSTSLTYAITELSSSGNTIFVRFKPSENNKGYGGSLQFSTTGTNMQRPDLSASSMPDQNSLDIVTWNLEWFGSSLGPQNNLLQAQLAIKVMDSLKADIYLLQEIVDTALLGYVSRNITNGPFDYVISPFSPNAQKLAFLYKKNMFSNVSTRGFTVTSTNLNNYYNWANGRYPFRMDATVNIAGKSKRISLINIHAKAETNNEPSNYSRRKGAADLLYDSLTIHHADEFFILGGDFNDDLDVTISQAVQETLTPYYSFMSDDFRFSPISYWNSLRGDNSYIGYPNVVDHMIVSYQMAKDYLPYSCIIRKEVTDWIPTYQSDLSDHYPVESRFDLQQSPSNLITSLYPLPALKEAIQIIHVDQADPLIKFITSVTGTVSIRLMSADGKTIWGEQLKHIPSGSITRVPMAGLPQGLYLLIVAGPNGVLSEKIIR